MFEQDYIMRLIKEMIRAVFKLLFGIDTESPSDEFLRESEDQETYQKLCDLVDKGKINEAENMVYDLIEEGDLSNIQVALLFYSYLNDQEDDFLEANQFSREEVKDGLKDVLSRYGMDNVMEMFL